MKIAGSYGSLIRGVSQQAPEVRLDGQHTEQVNMLSDPVAGLTRRRGTIFKARSALAGYTGPQQVAALTTHGGYREIEHSTGGKDYVILMRDKGSANTAANSLPPVMCYNRTDDEWLTVSWKSSTESDALTANGVSAAASLGAYLLFAMNNTPCSVTSSTAFGVTANHTVVVWIRGGVYNRTYSVRMPNGTTFSYTTPDATAPGAAAAISPQAIAASLLTAATAAGVVATVNGSHLAASATWNGSDVAVSDGGDGSLIRGVYSTVDSVDKLPLMALNGQIVKVQTGPDSWFYVKAYNKGAVSLSETIWREAPGVQQGVTLSNLGRARVVGSTLYIGYSNGSNVTGLDHMPAQPQPVPTLVPSQAGDVTTNVAPRWLSNQVTFMALFQDRLLVGSGAEVAVSGAGDYLNFFRSTVVTVPASDPFAMIAQGGEDDVLRYGLTYNRNLVLFGDKRQYMISGTTALGPTAANMTVMTVYPDAAEARPVAAGGQIFYARNREGSAAVHQIQPGQYVESAESFPASAQTGTYIPAPACVLETVPGAPALLVVRTRSAPQGLYVFGYIDAPDGRKQDAWYRWEFDPLNGNLLGVKNTPNGLLLFWARQANGVLYLVADLMPLSTAEGTLPYLDSMRKVTALGSDAGVGQAGWDVAFDSSTDRYLIGGTLADDLASLQTQYPAEASSLWAGIPFDSYFIPTNPYRKDENKRAVLSGRTVVTGLKVSTRASSGMEWEIDAGGLVKEGRFNGRRVGALSNVIGKVPITDTIVSIPIGRETRAYSLKVMARKWLPLNLINIEWTGQFFNRTPRA